MSGLRRTELVVVGAGPGGYSAAIRATQRGLDATLVERDAYGGTCLNHGCIPSKAFLSTTQLAEEARSASARGVEADVSTDLERMAAWKERVVRQLSGGVEALCRSNGVSLVEGAAEFVDATELRVRDAAGAETDRIAFDTAVVATGSRPATRPGFGFEAERVLSSRDALALTETPERLAVVGAGYVGMELATVFSRLGSEVTVIEAADTALPGYGDDATEVVVGKAKRAGIDFRFGETARAWNETADGIAVETETAGGETATYGAEYVLLAVGREPVTEGLGLGNAGVETDEEGFVRTDAAGRTSAGNVYAVGDAAGEPLLAHAATMEGLAAAEAAAGGPVDAGGGADGWVVPRVTFTDPEIAAVGVDAAAAERAGFDPVTGECPLRANGRALTHGAREGFVRLVAAADGRLLGAQLVAPEASELVAELALAIENGLSLADVAGTVHPHPTLSEAVREAAADALGRSVHTGRTGSEPL
jgi:dihydrolipoamide dehydrogenase